MLNLNFDINISIAEEKKAIIKSSSHRILVTAPPGTGKTFTTILKAKQIINSGFLNNDQKILILTFTNNAIRQIEETKKELLSSDEIKKVRIQTYYSLYIDLIKKFGRYIGLPNNFTVMNSYIWSYYYNKFLEKYNLSSSKKIKQLYSDAIAYKYNLISFNKKNYELINNAASYLSDTHSNLKIIDFNSIRNYAVHIISGSKFIRNSYNNRFPYIIIDEFQDTNNLEWLFIKNLVKKSALMCLADNNQQIFRFKGASITRLDEFQQTYSNEDFNHFFLENNYRNSEDIKIFADNILKMKNNYCRNSSFPVGNQIKIETNFFDLENQVYSKKWSIVKDIKNHKRIGILTKTKSDAEKISSCLNKSTDNTNQIYHHLIKDNDRKNLLLDIKLNIMLILLNNGNSSIYIELAKNLDVFTKQRYEFENKWTSIRKEINDEIIFQIENLHSNSKAKKILDLLVDNSKKSFEDSYFEVMKYFNDWLDDFDLEKANKLFYKIQKTEKDKSISKIKAVEVYKQNKLREINANKFLDEKGIYVMNMHKSKGKQFDVVYIFNFNDKIIPHKNEIENQNYQDSLNLFYVSVTRAKKKLYILSSGKSNHFNTSRFLKPFLN